MLVGDAGGFAFPFTGEGLCFAPYTGMRASETICAYLDGQFTQEELAGKYKENLKKIYDIADNYEVAKKKLSKEKFSGKVMNFCAKSKLIRKIGLRYCSRHPDFVNYAIQEVLDGDFSVSSIRKKYKIKKKELKKAKKQAKTA